MIGPAPGRIRRAITRFEDLAQTQEDHELVKDLDRAMVELLRRREGPTTVAPLGIFVDEARRRALNDPAVCSNIVNDTAKRLYGELKDLRDAVESKDVGRIAAAMKAATNAIGWIEY